MHLPEPRRSVVSFNRMGAGLGNRVRAVLGAQSLARWADRQFLYVWPVGRQFGPRLTDLWAFDAPTVPRAVSRALAPVWPYRDHTMDWLTPERDHDAVWQIRTAHALALPPEAGLWEEGLRALVPSPLVAGRVNEFYDRNLRGRRYVGVMIRAHTLSHAKTLESSPVEWFTRQMAHMAATDPGLSFFVSCDVPEVTAEVLRTIPGSVSQSDKGAYNSVPGVQAAVADLYLLAGSGYLLGPHWSSFVELAHILAGAGLTLQSPQGTLGDLSFDEGEVKDPLRPWARCPGKR